MKRLLRSVINFEDKQLSDEALVDNYQYLRRSGIEWMPIDERVYGFVKEFYDTRLEAPSVKTITDYYRGLNDIEVEERLKDIAAAQTYSRRNYEHLVDQLVESQKRDKLRALYKESEEILVKGLLVPGDNPREKVRLQGVTDSISHFTKNYPQLIPQDANLRTGGDLREDVDDAWADYNESEINKDKVYGAFTGLNNIDIVCRGVKRGELWVHAAYTGELKTTLALNQCYNLVTRYRRNVLYVSLEMPYKQIRNILYVMHSRNKKWADQGYKPLDYRAVRDGELTEDEKKFYRIVLDDFQNNPDHCRFEVWAPDTDVTVADIRLKAEALHKNMDIALTVIDHGGLVAPTKGNKDYTIELNSVLRSAKKFALHFNRNEGMAVVLLFQINRQGKDDADKNGGVYKMKALSYSNECERSADYITTTYLNDEHRANGTTFICNLKNRDNPLFEPFIASVDLSCRRIFNFDPTFSKVAGMSTDDGDDIMSRLDLI